MQPQNAIFLGQKKALKNAIPKCIVFRSKKNLEKMQSQNATFLGQKKP